MAMNKVYTRINWENDPSENTAIDEENLNRMDSAIDTLDNRIISQDAVKVDKTTVNDKIANWTMDEETGIITITKYSGEKIIFDLNVEKIPVSFTLSDDGILTMTTEDGTKFTADIGSMIPVLSFEDSDTIAVTVTGTGKNKTYSFAIKTGSVTADKLQPNYLADVTVQAGKASGSASDAANSALKAKESEDNAKESETAANDSAFAAKTSETNAKNSENSAMESKQSASSFATSAEGSKSAAAASATSANNSAVEALKSQTAAKTSETNASKSASTAQTSAKTATDNATLAKSYSVGGTGTREGEDVDNAKYYMEQAKQQTGGIPTKISELENDAGYIKKDVDNLVNYYDKTTTDQKLANIDLADYLKKAGDASNVTVTFTEPTELSQPTTGEKLSGIIGKVSLAIKNIKALITLIGNTDIKSIGDGTVTGAISDVNGKLLKYDKDKISVNKPNIAIGTNIIDGTAFTLSKGIYFITVKVQGISAVTRNDQRIEFWVGNAKSRLISQVVLPHNTPYPIVTFASFANVIDEDTFNVYSYVDITTLSLFSVDIEIVKLVK